MKVLHVCRTYFPDPPGGVQEAIRQICASTQSFGVTNTVFALSPQPQPSVLQRAEAKVVRCRSWAAPASCDLGGLDSVRTFRRLVEDADVVHYLFPWPFADVLRELAPKKPSVLTYISDIVRQRWLGSVYEPLMLRTLNSVDAIVSNAPQYVEGSAILSRGFVQEKLVQIPLGIDEETYIGSEDSEVLKRSVVRIGEPFILFIGVHRYYKGLRFLLEASAQVRGKIIIAGSGPVESELHVMAATMNLKNISFVGDVTHAEKLFLIKNCRALILPSHLRSEAFGMVLVEASMCGKPMITCEIGTGTSYVNIHNETGKVVSPRSSMMLADAMNELLADVQLSLRYGKAARKRYEALFSGPALGLSYSKLYEKVAH